MAVAGFDSRPTLTDAGSAALVFRYVALFDARGCVDHLEVFLSSDVVALVGDQIDKSAPGASFGLVNQQLHFLLAGLPSRALGGELLAVEELILAWVGEHRERIFERRRAGSQDCGED